MTDHVANAIGHFDIAGPDLGSLGEFYTELFGWTVTPRGPGYAMVEAPGGVARGAIVEDQTASLTIGIVVPDLDRALSQTVANGGTVTMPKTDNGWVHKAQITDPAGNRLTLIQS